MHEIVESRAPMRKFLTIDREGLTITVHFGDFEPQNKMVHEFKDLVELNRFLPNLERAFDVV